MVKIFRLALATEPVTLVLNDAIEGYGITLKQFSSFVASCAICSTFLFLSFQKSFFSFFFSI